jgi:hypothetical protein
VNRLIPDAKGEKSGQWVEALERCSIKVTRDILRDTSKAILQQYVDEGGIIYNDRGINAI